MNLLFDFDGVILDSNKIKNDAWYDVFKDYDEKHLKEFYEYNVIHGSVPRDDKIKYFFSNILLKHIKIEDFYKYKKIYSDITLNRLKDKNLLINDTLNYIKNTEHVLHIVSGTEENDLVDICNYLGIEKYFKSIKGSPKNKKELIKDIIQNDNKNYFILIGDSIDDLISAYKCGIKFYCYNNNNMKNLIGCNYISNFMNFDVEL